MNILSTNEKNQCTGCNACVQVCPENCIILMEDKEGFYYPKIDKQKCTDCGLCLKKCVVHNSKFIRKHLNNEPKILASWNLNENIRNDSSSGGVFTTLANHIIDNKGVVFGAAFDNNLSLHHIEADTKEKISKLRGSKYLQSKIGTTYKEAKKYLKSGRKVLFSGTPCQIAGLCLYLGKHYENLYTVGLVCHGVPSPKVFKKYTQFLEKKYNSIIKSINFRDKSKGWKRYSTKIKFDNGFIYCNILNKDIFMRAFLSNLCLRPSCHNCKFTNIKRVSDITIGDFWGINRYKSSLDDDKGISLLLINSKKGQEIFNECNNNLFYEECDIEKSMQHNLKGPSIASANREKFFEELDYIDFDKLVNKYVNKLTLYWRVRGILGRIKKYLSKCCF